MWPFKDENFSTGFVPNEEQHTDPRNLCYDDIAFGAAPVPESGDVFSRKPFFLNQWGSSSCTTHASVSDIHQTLGRLLSARHAYFKIKRDPKYDSSRIPYGAYMKDAIVVLIKDGVADYELCPDDNNHISESSYVDLQETVEMAASAKKNVLGGSYIYPTIARGSQAIFDSTIRYMWEQKRPVMIGVQWYSDYNDARDGGVIKAEFPKSDSTGHALLAVVWKTINGEPYIGCVNSWGDYWGDKGMVWIPRNFSVIYTAIAYIPEEVEKDLKIVKTTVEIPVRDLHKERSNAQELRAIIDSTFPNVPDVKANTQNILARSIGGREWLAIVKAVVYLGWSFTDVLNYLYAKSRGKTDSEAYSLDFTVSRDQFFKK